MPTLFAFLFCLGTAAALQDKLDTVAGSCSGHSSVSAVRSGVGSGTSGADSCSGDVGSGGDGAFGGCGGIAGVGGGGASKAAAKDAAGPSTTAADACVVAAAVCVTGPGAYIYISRSIYLRVLRMRTRAKIYNLLY